MSSLEALMLVFRAGFFKVGEKLSLPFQVLSFPQDCAKLQGYFLPVSKSVETLPDTGHWSTLVIARLFMGQLLQSMILLFPRLPSGTESQRRQGALGLTSSLPPCHSMWPLASRSCHVPARKQSPDTCYPGNPQTSSLPQPHRVSWELFLFWKNISSQNISFRGLRPYRIKVTKPAIHRTEAKTKQFVAY